MEINPDKELTTFTEHSVWETPEGKLVDVTLNQSLNGYGSNWGRNEIYFIPVKKCNPKEGFYFFPFCFCIHDDVTKPVERYSDQFGYQSSPRRIFEKNKITLDNLWFYRGHSFFEEHRDKLNNQSFSNPSISTGEYFEMRTTCR